MSRTQHFLDMVLASSHDVSDECRQEQRILQWFYDFTDDTAFAACCLQAWLVLAIVMDAALQCAWTVTDMNNRKQLFQGHIATYRNVRMVSG